ncbi:MAG: ABC transporter substrate-binding protein [Chloroflexi bacterium]|nr:ABC transporter substrate-binding protein [Chloroflexota bacterium]
MFRKLLLPFLALTLLLSACATPATPAVQPAIEPTIAPTVAPTVEPTAEPTAEPIALTDSLGREVTLAAPAQRIVSLAPSNTEIAFAIGAGGQLIGRDDFSDYPPEAASVPSVGSLYPNVNAEAIVALKPDLVLAAGITSPDDVKALADLGLTVYATSYAVTLDDVYGDILAVGKLTGHAVEAENLVVSMKARVEAISAKTAPLATRPNVFYETDDTDPSSPWTRGPNSYAESLINLAGGVNVGSVGSAQDFQMSLEEIVNQNPDIIIFSHASYSGRTPEQVMARPGWETIKAVEIGAVFAIDGNLIDRPGPRVVDGLEALAKLIHPELFK